VNPPLTPTPYNSVKCQIVAVNGIRIFGAPACAHCYDLGQLD